MHTPQHNPNGYDNSTITDMAALSESVRFLVMHGASDDNVHLQNTLVLIDKLDLSNVENYDVQFYPDSDHSIYFHNAHMMVYHRMSPPSLLLFRNTNQTRSFGLARQCIQRGVASDSEARAGQVNVGAYEAVAAVIVSLASRYSCSILML